MVKTLNQHGQFTIQYLLDDLCPLNSKRWTLDRQKLSFQTHVDISVKDTNLSISGAWHVMVEFELVSNGASIVLDPTGAREEPTVNQP